MGTPFRHLHGPLANDDNPDRWVTPMPTAPVSPLLIQ